MNPRAGASSSAPSPSSLAIGHTLMRECLTFRIGGEEFGIDILQVQEIRGYETPTRIAGAPSFIKGVLNLRGVIVPVVDLRTKFGEAANCEPVTVTIILSIAGRTVGAVVDSVSDVIELTLDQIRPAPEFNSSIDANHIVGIGVIAQSEGERMLILLDIGKLMSSFDMGLIPALH